MTPILLVSFVILIIEKQSFFFLKQGGNFFGFIHPFFQTHVFMNFFMLV